MSSSTNYQSVEADAIDKLVALGAKAPAVAMVQGGVPFVALPADQRLHSLKEFVPPDHIETTATLQEAGSFIEYVNRFKDADSLIFANVSDTGVRFDAVLDYHTGAECSPRYCSHIAIFSAIESPEWRAWRAANRVQMTQVEFATWLEDNATLVVEPKGAELLELVRSLHGHVNARFNQAVRLDNGAYTASYEEDVSIRGSNGTKQGEVKLPPEIIAGMAVFQGGDPYKIRARLKCRMENRELKLWFETVRVHAVVRESIMLLVQQIAEKTGIVPMLGQP